MMRIIYRLWTPLAVLWTPLIGASPPRVPVSLPSGPLVRDVGNPLVRNGPEGYDFWKTGPRVILKMGPRDYRMWYEAVGSDSFTRVAYATSRDGRHWTKKGVVLSPGGMDSWEKKEVSPNALRIEDGVFRLWYHAGGYPSGSVRLGKAGIGLATSKDGLRWTKHARNPLLDTGPAGALDERQVAEPRVLKVRGHYRMYYTAVDASQHKSLCLATSPDGLRWTRYAHNPILPFQRWGGWGGALLVEDGLWHLWHAAQDDVSGLGYKWSRDGLAWSDGPGGLVLAPNADPRAPDLAVGDSVSGYRDGDTYRILYTGANMTFPTGRLEAICQATIQAKPRPQGRHP